MRFELLLSIATFICSGSSCAKGYPYKSMTLIVLDMIKRLNDVVNKIQAEASVKKYFSTQSMRPVGGSLTDFDKVVREDYARWTKVVQAIAFKPD